MRTVKDILDERDGSGVFWHRHATYLMNPEGKDNPTNPNLLAAQNCARVYPDHNNPLDQNGRDVSVAQGVRLTELGVKVNCIWVSRQGRGPETGLYVGIGILNSTGQMPSIDHAIGADYPVYSSPEAVLEALKLGDGFPAYWLNGKLPELCTITPDQFTANVWMATKEAMSGGTIFIASHFENVMLVHGLFVAKQRLGTIPTDWLPTKSAGILVVLNGNAYAGFEYDTNFNIVQ